MRTHGHQLMYVKTTNMVSLFDRDYVLHDLIKMGVGYKKWVWPPEIFLHASRANYKEPPFQFPRSAPAHIHTHTSQVQKPLLCMHTNG